MLAYQQKESTARVASIMENTNLSKQQQVSEIMRQMLTQAQTAVQYFTNDQIKEMTRKVSAEVDLVLFFFNDPATTEIYTLSLHDALPIYFGLSGREETEAGRVDARDAEGCPLAVGQDLVIELVSSLPRRVGDGDHVAIDDDRPSLVEGEIGRAHV